MSFCIQCSCSLSVYDVTNTLSGSKEQNLQRQKSTKMIKSTATTKPNVKWRVGSLCEMFSPEAREWVHGDIVNLFSDELGDWIRVQYGQRIRDVLRDGPFVRERQSVEVHGKKTWFNVLQCVTQELFPVLSIKINECVQEKILQDVTFKMSDIWEDDHGDDPVTDILARLMTKRTMNNKEIDYLKELVQRMRLNDNSDHGLVQKR